MALRSLTLFFLRSRKIGLEIERERQREMETEGEGGIARWEKES